MVHPDHKTRIGAHRIFSVVLVPTSVCPRPSSTTTDLKKGMGLPRSLSRTASVFSSSAALFEKLKKDKFSSMLTSDHSQNGMPEEERGSSTGEILDRLKSSYRQAYSTWNQPLTSVVDNSVDLLNSELVHPCNLLCVKKLTRRVVHFLLTLNGTLEFYIYVSQKISQVSQNSFRMGPTVYIINEYKVAS